MKKFPNITVCGLSEINSKPKSNYAISILSFESPNNYFPYLEFKNHMKLYFDDVSYVETNKKWGIVSPSQVDIEKIVLFGRYVLENSKENDEFLIHCAAGISRSTAATFIILCDWMGEGREKEALKYLEIIRPNLWPNSLMVSFGDKVLNRNGKMIDAYNEFLEKQKFDTDNMF